MIDPSQLLCISVISNPRRYRSRPRLFKDFLARQAKAGITQVVVEATFGERAPEIADSANPNHVIVRCDAELWLKENLINVAARRFGRRFPYIMWCDADIAFVRSDWAIETIHALQHYDVVQPFSHLVDLGPNLEIMETHTGFAFCYRSGEPFTPGYGRFWHPGYAFAWRRDAWEAVGGMIDLAILGAGDHHMACALIGKANYSYPANINSNYKAVIDGWQRRADRAVNKNIGYFPGTILHYYHGRKENRAYIKRWDILIENDFDPLADVSYDLNGVLHFTTQKRGLIEGCRAYFAQRNEDA